MANVKQIWSYNKRKKDPYYAVTIAPSHHMTNLNQIWS